MANFNKVILAGNLTRDPELRYTPSGSAIAKIGLAINRSWRDQNGESRTDTTFVDVDAFGKQAETIGQYLRKGRPILIEGRLRLDSWDDKQTGQKRSRMGVVLETFQFLDGGRGRDDDGGDSGDNPSHQQPPPAPQQQPRRPAPTSRQAPPIDDDDVPF